MSDAATTYIADLVQTHAGYSAQVDLELLFHDTVKNLATMRRYKPTVSHRRVFEHVVRALDNKDKRVYLITGNYGTGKSHLSLMLANYFAYASDQPDIAQFLDNYATEAPDVAEKLRARRKQGRYLVVLCDYDSTDDLGEVVLRAVLDALKSEGLTDTLQTPYEEARRKLEQLEADQQGGQGLVHYHDLFAQQLPHHQAGVTFKAFKDKLYPGMDHTALDAFKRMHQEILRTPFTYEAGNLSAILKSTLSSPAFLERFAGLAVFWDEFGYTLGDPNRLSLNVFQQFAQLCADFDPTRGKLIFVATAHKGFEAYAPAWAAEDYSKIKDRVETVNLFPDGLEDVIGAVVSPDREHALWKSTVLPQATSMWNQWITAARTSGIFDWLVTKPPVFRSKILEGVYPMHPMATYAVIQLARQVASQNRTVFTFFSSEKEDVFEDGSYLWYIHNHTVVNEQGNLRFYTVDLLFDYFHTRLQTTNVDLTPQAKERVSNYEAARIQLKRAQNQNLMYLSDTGVIERILRVMLIYDLIDVHNSLENLAFGLNVQPSERPALEAQLVELVKFGVVHRNPATQLYEFRRSDLFDVDSAVEQYKREEGDKLGNLAADLTTLTPLSKKEQYLESKGYNMQYSEDKRLERRMVTPGDLAAERVHNGTTMGYCEWLETQIEQEVNKAGDLEGLALYVVCESTADITTARDLAARNTSRRIIVAIPNTPIGFKDAILNVKAIEQVNHSPEAAHFSTQDKALVAERERLFRQALQALRDELLDARKLTWLGVHGKVLAVDRNKPDDPATRVMQERYTSRNRFSHDDFNMTHDVRSFTRPHNSLVEAVNALLKSGAVVTIDEKQPDNRGEIRYLQRCLYQQGALIATHKQGNVTYVEVERDTTKFESKLPALADMLHDIQALGEQEQLRLQAFFDKYRQPPYGLGNIALALLFAEVVRFFGDTIKVKKDSTSIGNLYIADFDLVADLVKGNYPNAYIQYREIRPGERALINGVVSVFAGGSAAQSDYTATNAYDAVATWYQGIAPVAQVADFYPGPEDKATLGFLAILEKLNAQDAHTFVLGELQTVLGHDATEMVTSTRAQAIVTALQTAKDRIEGAEERVQSRIRDGLCRIFGVQGNTWDDVSDGVRAWYNGLDANQRSTAASWHNEASKPLAQLFVDLSNPRDIFLDRLPDRPSYNFKRVRDWNVNLITDYLAKIEAGVQHIQANKIKVPSPVAELIGDDYKEQKNTVFFTGKLVLRLSHPDPNVRIFVTDSFADPRHARQRDEFQGVKDFDIAALVQTVRSTVTIQYIPQDAEANWGVLQSLSFMDETIENEIRKPRTLISEMKYTVKFVFPTTEAGVRSSCRSFFNSLLENEVLDRERLRAVVQEILDDLTNK